MRWRSEEVMRWSSGVNTPPAASHCADRMGSATLWEVTFGQKPESSRTRRGVQTQVSACTERQGASLCPEAHATPTPVVMSPNP